MNRRLCVFASLLVAAPAFGQAINYRVSTFAGTSVFRDAVPATGAFLKEPRGLVYDRGGNLYIADSGGHLVRRVSPTGTSTVVAGNGNPGFSGDLGPAKSARLVSPYGLALDIDGNLFISDSGLHNIRRVSVDGTITTVAGTGTSGFSGDGGPATSAALRTPLGLAVDADRNLLICDSGNGRIRRVTPSGVISTMAGTGATGSSGDGGPATAAQLSSPRGIAIDSDSTIYVAEFGGNRIRRIDGSGTITTFAGNGTAQSLADGVRATSISGPIAVTASSGIVYFIEFNSNRVRTVNFSGLLTTVAGPTYGFRGDGGPVTAAAMAFPSGLAVNGSTLTIADTENNRVRAIQDGMIRTIAGRDGATGDGGPASEATLHGPVYLASRPDGTIAFSDRNNFRIRAISPTGIIQTVVGTGEPGFAVSSPTPAARLRTVEGLAYVNGANDITFSTYLYHSIVQSYTSSGTPSLYTSLQVGNSFGASGFAGDGGPAGLSSVRLNGPAGLVYDQRNSLYIADQRNHRIRLVSNVSTPRGTLSTFAGNGSAAFSGDGGPASLAGLNSPSDVALAPNGDLLIADQGNARIRRVDAAGKIATMAGGGTDTGDFIPATTAKLTAPTYVSSDAQGNIYFSDASRIRVVTTSGTLYTIAGTGLSGFAGDGRLGTAATFYQPSKMIVDAKGNVFVADYANDRIRMLAPLNPSTLTITSGDGQTGATGSRAAQLLTVTVTAADGTPLPNIPVTFKVESGQATLTGASARTLADGTAAVNVTFGTTAGAVIVSGSAGSLAPVRFSLTASSSSSVAAKLEATGDRQFAVISTALSNPLTVRALDAAGLPIPGLAIAWRVSSGTATLSETTNTTQADGSASVKVTLGDTPGPVTITAATATGGPVAVQFSLTALTPAPEITPDSLMGAGQSDAPVRTASPLGLMTFRAARLLPFGVAPKVAGPDDLVDGKLPVSFLGVCVDVNGIRAPLTAIEADSVRFQVPPLGEATQAKVVLARDCGQPFELRSSSITIDAAAQAPELFIAGRTAENLPRVLALGPDGVALTAAPPESTISLMATGLGFTNPALAPGEYSVAELPVASPVTVSIAGQEMPADAVSVPGAPGRYAVRLKLPAGLPNIVEITVTVNGVTSPVVLLSITN